VRNKKPYHYKLKKNEFFIRRLILLRDFMRRLYRELVPVIYGRSKYKLFMHSTFAALDERTRSILCATNVLPTIFKPVPIKAPFGKSMLVIAPHQDDEIIGCGGAMLQQIKTKNKVHVVFTHDGGDDYIADGNSRAEQAEMRNQEARTVAKEMGIEEPKFLMYERLDREMNKRLANDIRKEIKRVAADVIFTPFILDPNIHHRLTNYALAKAIKDDETRPKIIGYEVWALTIPNIIVNIDEVMREKQRLLGIYKSQLSGKDYLNGITGLNMYHSMNFGAGECRFAERFFEMPAVEFVRVMRRI
jgi:LmbE family N-acetylglucosaminyl deacetylase